MEKSIEEIEKELQEAKRREREKRDEEKRVKEDQEAQIRVQKRIKVMDEIIKQFHIQSPGASWTYKRVIEKNNWGDREESHFIIFKDGNQVFKSITIRNRTSGHWTTSYHDDLKVWVPTSSYKEILFREKKDGTFNIVGIVKKYFDNWNDLIESQRERKLKEEKYGSSVDLISEMRNDPTYSNCFQYPVDCRAVEVANTVMIKYELKRYVSAYHAKEIANRIREVEDYIKGIK